MNINKKFRPTSYIVMFWNEDGSEKIKEEIYPMHLYSFDDVITLLQGKEDTCDIYEGRYFKNKDGSGKYTVTGKTYIWDSFKWVLQM